MNRVRIKPLSVNSAFQGRRFKTPKYKAFEKELLLKLPTSVELFKKMELHIVFGFARKSSDLSNPLKLTEDVLSKKYGFNDNQIYKICLEKVVGKGEFIEFELRDYNGG